MILALATALLNLPANAPLDSSLQVRGDASTIVVTEEHARAVERGLDWLAKKQNADGSWTARIGYKLNNGFNFTSADKGHLGVTALSGMAFLAGGHLPGRGRHGPNIEKALSFVATSRTPDRACTTTPSRRCSSRRSAA
jgi:hypothetical protein